MVSKNIIPVGARSQKRWQTAFYNSKKNEQWMWRKGKNIEAQKDKGKRKEENKVMKQNVCKGNYIFIHSHIWVPTMCQQTVLDICDKSVNKRDRVVKIGLITLTSEQRWWRRCEIYSCGSLGEVHSRQRKEPVQRSEGRSLPSVFGEQEGGQCGGRK